MRALWLLLMVAGTAFSAAAGVREIGFDRGTNPGWNFFLSDEAPGAQGNFLLFPEPVGMPPERCGRLELAYREGGWYSGIKYYFPTPVPFEEIQIRVFSPDFHGIVVRLIDQSSQTHQLFLPFKSGEGWQTVTVRRPKWSYHFWAGANDGKWHGGIVGIQLLAEGIRLNDRKARRGFLYFNRISVITPQNGNDVK